MTGPALPADERPVDDTPVHTDDLPATPVRDRNIPASAWVEAPPELVELAERRRSARAERDFAAADRLREEIEAAGWEVRDAADGFQLVPKR